MSAVEIARDALFGNPPSPTMKPSREGVLAAIDVLQEGVAAAALAGTDLNAAAALVAPIASDARAARDQAQQAFSAASDAKDSAATSAAAAQQVLAQSEAVQGAAESFGNVATEIGTGSGVVVYEDQQFGVANRGEFIGPPGNTPFTNIRDYDGEPDNSDTSPALASALAAGATFLVLPAQTGSNVQYRFNSDIPINDLISRTIDVDPVVTLSEPTDIILNAAGGLIQYARRTKHFFRNLGVEYHSLPDGNLTPMEKSVFLDNGQPDASRWISIQANDGKSLKPLKVAWPGSDSWEADTFSASAAASYAYAPGATDGRYHMAFRNMFPGQRYFARPDIGGNPLLVAIIRHSGGYVGISAMSNDAATVDIIQKANGSAGTSAAGNFLYSQTHASYFPRNSTWSIDVESWNMCSVLFNGVVVARFTTPGIISDAGFGMYPLAAGDSATWNDPVVGIDLPPSAGRLLSILAPGDSRFALRDACPATYCRNALDLSYGTRVSKFDNMAIGGQTSGQQRAAFEARDISGYNIVVVPLGTNNVQAGLTVSGFAGDLTAIANRAKTVGATPIFVIFPLWYSQGQAGARGQNTQRYEQSAPFRSRMLRFCADNGYPVLDLSHLTGPVIAQYVNASLSPNLVGLGDPVVFDNIHFTAVFNKIYGTALAKTILGTLFTKPTLRLGEQGIAGKNGWSAGGGTELPTYSVSPSGRVQLAGSMNKPSAGIVSGTAMATLPAHLFTGRTHRFRVVSADAENGYVEYNGSTGDLTPYGFSTSAYLDLTGVSFNVAVL